MLTNWDNPLMGKINIYPAIYRSLRLLWPGGWKTRQYLNELKKTQWLSQIELEVWQLNKIKKLVKYAYEYIPYYHEVYQREGIHPQDIKSLQDFQSLPILTKENINQHLYELVSPHLRSKAYRNQTGGSTGQPMQFFIEGSFWWWNAALEFRGRGWHGIHQGDKVAWVWGAQRDMPDWSWSNRFKASVMRYRYMNAFSMTEAKMQAFANELLRWQPVMIIAYPSALTLFAKYIQEHHFTGIHPLLIETTAEKISEIERQLLKDVFHCKVVDHYSSRELGTIAYECEAGKLHVCETRFLETIINNHPAKSGQLGKIIVTSLNQFLMPLIRYETGDLGVLEDINCSCRRCLSTLKEIAGRKVDFLVTADGQFVHGEYFAYIFRAKHEVTRYQVYQADRQHLEVRLICNKNVDQTWLDAAESELHARFGTDMYISIQVVDSIPLTPAGKHRFIISEVTPDF